MPNQSMQLLQSQRLQMVLAPQLRQSLEMLQLPILELRAMVQQELEKNPTIEEIITENERAEIEPGDGKTETSDEMDFDKEFEALAKLDEEWRDYFFQDLQNKPFSRDAEEKHQFLLDSIPQQESLQEHLISQLSLSGMSETDKQIGELIIGSVDDDGYLTTSVEDLASSTGFDDVHIKDVLMVVQDFHPTGVASFNLQGCLLAQLARLDKVDTLAGDIVRNHLDKLAGKKYTDIAKAMKVSTDDVKAACVIISTLDPKPGRIYSDEVSNYVLPEVHVKKVEGEYVVILNDEQLPHIRISKHYKRILKDKDTKKEVKEYIVERIKAGAFLIKSIHQRQKTLFRIATEIVKNQTAFLDEGVAFLKPMTMSAIADAVGVHETTVSRAVSSKYMLAPKGLFELKYFFTPGIKTASGQEVSNKTVKDIIATLVAEEDNQKPLSDQDIMAALDEQGISIARRTVAKYRMLLHIPPSHMRKAY